MNIFLIHHRSSHHAANSGYGRLVDYLDAQVIYGNSKLPYRLAKSISKLHSQDAGTYNSSSVLKSIELYQVLKKHTKEDNIVHFLNGERDIRHLNFFKKRFPKTKFCATFHKPPEILEQIFPDTAELRKLDGAIAVGANQVTFLKEWLQMENVSYIPHGVDTNFFIPNYSIRAKNNLLFVGQHLRDFDMLNKTLPKIASAIDDLLVNVIVHPAYSNKIEPQSYISVFSSVNDEALRHHYQKATILYLPMLDSTACNSILEALACGLPIVSSLVGGNSEYLQGTTNILVGKGTEGNFEMETISLLGDQNRLKEIGRSSRLKANDFEWTNLVLKINAFYTSIV